MDKKSTISLIIKIIAYLLLWPIFLLIWIWNKSNWPKNTKWLATAGIGVVFLFVLMSSNASKDTKQSDQNAALNSKIENLEKQLEEEKQKNNQPVEEKTEEITKQENSPEESTSETYLVVSVVDGDTVAVEINGEKEVLRLIGINTPETVDPRKPVECFGKEASNKAKEILTGQRVRLEADPTQGELDKYNRLLRYVILEDGTNFNKKMIEDGYAYENTYNVPYRYQTEFKEAEKTAREAGRGLWAKDTCNGKLTANNSAEIEAAPKSTTPAPQNTGSFSGNCAGKKTCGQMTSCEEAYFYLNNCGVGSLDRDKDGIPCETICN